MFHNHEETETEKVKRNKKFHTFDFRISFSAMLVHTSINVHYEPNTRRCQ